MGVHWALFSICYIQVIFPVCERTPLWHMVMTQRSLLRFRGQWIRCLSLNRDLARRVLRSASLQILLYFK